MIEIDLFFNTFTILFLICFFITTLFYVFAYKEKRIRLSFIGIFEMYILMVIKIVILPVRIIIDETLKFESVQNFSFWKAMQLIPLHSIREFLESGNYLQIVGNLLLLLPLPLFFYFLFNKNNLKKILICSFCFCLGIELIQLCICLCTRFTSRIFDVDDILLNCIGILLGCSFCCLLKKASRIHVFISQKFVYRV